MPAMQNGLNILHLEDDRLDADLIRDTLTSQGIVANIVGVETEREFRSSLGNGKVDLILADYSLPGFSGMAALAIARENRPELPFIFVSGTIGEEIAIETLKSGATDYVLKHRLQRLGLSVRRALSEAEERLRRKVADGALRESETRYRVLFDHNPLPQWVYDLETLAFLAVNEAAIHHYGYSRQEFLAMTIKDIHHRDCVPALGGTVTAFVNGLARSGVCQHRKKDGSIIDAEITSHSIEFSGRQAEVVLGMDITERKRAEERLRLQSAALESAANAIVLTDEKGAIIWVNDAFTQTTGYSKEEVLGKNPRLLKSGKQNHAFYQDMWDTILAGKIWRNTIINRCKDGTFNHEDLTITPIRNSAGKITHFVGIKQDIAEKTRAEEAQRSSELRYRRLFESAKDGILIVDADTRQIVDVNPFLMEMLGFSKEEFVGKELWQIGLFKDVAASKLAFAELQQRGYIRYEDLPLETREGLVKPVEFVSNSYLVGESRVIQCNIRDITERKRFEQALQEKNIELGNANLAKNRFLANMSHELRTPLNAIIGFTGTLLMRLPGPLNADQEHQLSIVQTSARHLLSLINDLLDLAKVESGMVEIKYEPLVCQEVMEEVAEALRPLAEAKGLEFKIKAPKSGVRIGADRRILSQILINLSNNAIKFTEKGQVQIQLSTRQSNGQILASIEVIDTGIGIRIEDQKKLFQEFQQVSTDHRNEGTGLGLYLSEKLAILINGKIEFESEYGKGSTFRLLVPTA